MVGEVEGMYLELQSASHDMAQEVAVDRQEERHMHEKEEALGEERIRFLDLVEAQLEEHIHFDLAGDQKELSISQDSGSGNAQVAGQVVGCRTLYSNCL